MRVSESHERTDEDPRPDRPGNDFRPDQDPDGEPGADPVLVVRRDQEARDHQLPHVQAGARRAVLRPHLRPDQGLRVPVRQVQADEVPRHHLREVRRRGHAGEGAPRAHGPYRAGLAGRAYLVPEVAAEPDRPDGRSDAEGAGEDPVFRELRGAGTRHHRPEAAPAAHRGPAARQAGRVRRRPVRGRHRRRGDQEGAAQDRSRRGEGEAARRPEGDHLARPSARSWSSA